MNLKSEIDPDEVLAKGAALQAISIVETYPLDSAPATALHARSKTESSVVSPAFLAFPIGLVLNAAKDDKKAVDGKSFVTLVAEHSPLPVRRIVDFDVPAGSGPSEVLLSLWEGSHEVKVEAPEPKKKAGFFSRKADEDEEDDDEPEDVRTAIVKPTKAVADLVVAVETKPEGKGKKGVPAKVRVTIVVDAAGKGSATAVQLRSGAQPTSAQF